MKLKNYLQILMILKLQNQKQIFSVFLLASIFLFFTFLATAQETEDDDNDEITLGVKVTKTLNTDDDPVEIFYKAQDAHSKGDLELALKLYTKALEVNPEFPEAEFQRGNIFQTLGKPDKAEKSLRRAIELRRDWSLPIAELGALLVKKGEYIEAETLLNKAIRLNNMSFPAYVALAEIKIITNAPKVELKTLLGKLQYLTTKSKIPASIWASRGAIERKLGDIPSAKSSIYRALKINGKDVFALEESIEISLLVGDIEGALKNAKNLSTQYPNSKNAKLLLARSLHSNGNSSEAIKILDSIKNPRADIVKLKYAIALQGNYNIEDLELVLEEDKNNVSVLGRLCILSRTKQPNKALSYCKKASQLEPKEINHVIGYGAALVQLKRYLDAVNLFTRLSNFTPENYSVRANLATALFQLKRFKEAKKQYFWITQKQPKLAAGYYFLAISHDRLNEYLDAMANYQQFLKLADDSLKLEVEKVNLRLPILEKQIKKGKGKNRR